MQALARPAHRRCAGERGARSSWRDDAAFRGLRPQPRSRGADRLMPLPAGVAEALRRIVGRESVIDAPNDLRIFERDGSIEGAIPDTVMLASSTDHVTTVSRVADKQRIT